MNLSNPVPIKSNEKKKNFLQTGFEKMWAGISMISLMAPGPTTRENVSVKNIGVLIFILIVGYLGSCGVYQNIQWLKHISITGEWFYYVSIPIIIFVIAEFFNMEKKVREFALQKKVIYVYKKSLLENWLRNFNKVYIAFSFIIETVSFLWMVVGIIFYDRTLFIVLLSTSLLLSIITAAFKKPAQAKAMFISEAIIFLSIVLFILVNHFCIQLSNFQTF